MADVQAHGGVKLISLEPYRDSNLSLLSASITTHDTGSLPPFTILCTQDVEVDLGRLEELLGEVENAPPSPLVLALKKLRYKDTTRYLYLIDTTEFSAVENQISNSALLEAAHFVAFWSKENAGTSVEQYMESFYVVFPQHWQRFKSGNELTQVAITLVALSPAILSAAPVELKSVTVPMDDPPEYTTLVEMEYHGADTESIVILDGAEDSVARTTETALLKLRRKEFSTYVLVESFQRDAKQIARMQMEIDKSSAASVAFWQSTEGYGKPMDEWMDLFVVLPNRTSHTERYFTALNYAVESKEIRVLVLPPSHGQKTDKLECEFRNLSLNDPVRPQYQLFQIAGPAMPRNGRGSIYQYDVEIGGNLCSVEDGTRKGLKAIQHETEERLVFDRTICINHCDPIDAKYFSDLDAEICRGAVSGVVLLYDLLGGMIPMLNSNRGFKYPTLDRKTTQIRLLEFVRSGEVDKIECNLIITELNSFPTFKALSYTWGGTKGMILHEVTFTPEDVVENFPIVNNPSRKIAHIEDFDNLVEKITINHQPFLITKTLAAALRCLRDRGDSQYFWVDAICIDQSDTLDRSSQVRMMADIYAAAQGVIAWLGESENEGECLKVLNMLGSDELDISGFKTWLELTSSQELRELDKEDDTTAAFRTIMEGIHSQSFKKSLAAILDNDWWSRVWVYQEATIPHNLYLHRGTSNIKFEALWGGVFVITLLAMDGVLKLDILGQPYGLHHNLSIIRQARRRRHLPETCQPIPNEYLYTLEALGNREASDPRDIIYASLGIAEGAPTTIIPDYSKSIIEVWASAARSIIKRDQDLILLSLCGGVMKTAAPWADYEMNLRKPNQSMMILPSWAPFWGRHREGMGAKKVRHDWMTVPDFQACGGLIDTHPKFSKDGAILFLKGRTVDVVSKVVPGHEQTRKKRSSSSDAEATNSPSQDRADSDEYSAWHHGFSKWENAVTSIMPKCKLYTGGGTKFDAFINILHAPFSSPDSYQPGDDLETDGDFFLLRNDEFNVVVDTSKTSEDGTLQPTIVYYLKDGEQAKYKLKSTESFAMMATFPSKLAYNLHGSEGLGETVPNLTFTSNYELIVTEKGYIGVCPPPAREFGGVLPGDLVVVMCGGNVPLILRQVGNRDRYLLVADAYIHGLMYGAAMENLKMADMTKFPLI